MLRYFISFIALFIPFLGVVWSQNQSAYGYEKMRELAFKGQYSEAISMGKVLLNETPTNKDVSILLARSYMWRQQYDSASIIIDGILVEQPNYAEAVEAKFDLAFYNSEFPAVIEMGKPLISQYPTRIDFKEKVAIAHLELKHNDDALANAHQILELDSANRIALGIIEQLKTKPIELSLGYFVDHFSVPYTRWWHVYTLGALKPTSWGSVAGRANLGHLGDLSNGGIEPQIEVESTVNLTKKAYMMLLYGYSPSTYFPTHKAAIEVWHKLPYDMVASLGGSYFYWDNSIFFATASLEKYINDYWFCARTYIQFKDIGPTSSFYFTARKYIQDVDYAQIMVGYGAAPDEPFDVSDLNRQNAFSVRLAYLKQLNGRTKLRAGLGYSYEEYLAGEFRHRYEGGLTLIYSLVK